MRVYTNACYQHPQEVWDAKKCEKIAKCVCKDGWGTPYPWPGYIGCSTYPGGWGTTRYNGLCERNGNLYRGEHRPLPAVAPGFKIIHVRTWGYRLIKTGSKRKT